MRGIWAVFKKETGIYFHSFIFYFFGLVYLFILGLIFSLVFIVYATQLPMRAQMAGGNLPTVNTYILRPVFGDMGFLLILFLPFYTMRLLAEERRHGTLELLFTSPITPAQVVLGKFLASFTLFIAITSIPIFYCFILDYFGDVDWLPILSTYLGIFLLGGSLIALGLFFSSITNNQLIAAVLTLGGYLLFWIIGWMGQSGATATLFRYLSIYEHYEPFTQGLIDTQDVFYYFSLIFLWLFLTYRSLESQGWR